MFQHQFKSTVRFLIRNKGFTLINIFGLAIGLASFLLIMLFVSYHLNFDGFHQRGDRIYRVITQWEDETFAGSNPVEAPLMARTTPEVEDFVRLGRVSWDEKVTVTIGDKKFIENEFYLADSSFFKIFSLPLVAGDPETVLNDPRKVVITRSTARKYFGDADPLGQVIRLNDRFDFVVSGIAADVPGNSHLGFKFLAPFGNVERIYGKGSLQSWGSYNYMSYLLCAKSADPDRLRDNILQNIKKYPGLEPEQVDYFAHARLQPFNNIHFRRIRGNHVPAVDTRQLYIFSSIAIAILLIACINFMNLSITLSMKRLREIGLRKILGASRRRLYRQFFGETAMIVLAAMATAFVLMEVLLPTVRQLTNTPLDVSWTDPVFWGINVVIFAVVVLVAGGYPAWYISRFEAAGAARSASQLTPGNIRLRNVLVTFQFVISLVLIIATVTILRQLHALRQQDPGISAAQLINIPLYDKTLRDDITSLKTAVRSVPGVQAVSASRFKPGRDVFNHSIYWEGMNPDTEKSMWLLFADEDFVNTYDLNLVEGRNFYKDETGKAYLLNQQAVKALGWKKAAGRDFSAFGKDRPGKVTGVVENFSFRSLHHPMEPIAIMISNRNLDQLSVRCKPGSRATVMKQIDKVWADFGQSGEPEFYFVDEAIARQYDTEARMAGLTGYFTLLSILISCLGLFGLISGITRQRNHEIAVRKVFGASAGRIVLILSNKLLLLILLAGVIAWPVAWYLMDRWLTNFAFPVGLPLWLFAGSTLAAMAVALLTMSSQTMRAARKNPADVLKYE